jgi:WD40 repeat protein
MRSIIRKYAVMLLVSNVFVFTNSSANPNKDGSEHNTELTPSIKKVVYVTPPDKCLIRTFDTKDYYGKSDSVSDLALSPDGKFLASVNSYECSELMDDPSYGSKLEICKIKLWNALNGKLIGTFDQFNSDVSSIAYSLDGKTIVSGNDYGYIHLWNVSTGELSQTIKDHWQSINAITFRSKDDMSFVTGSDRGRLKLWTVKEQATSTPFGGKTNDFLSIENLALGKEKKNNYKSIALSNDGKKIIARFSIGQFEKGIQLIDIDKRDVLWRKDIPDSFGSSLALSPDDKKVIYAYNFELILLDATTGEKQKTFEREYPSGSVTTVTFSPDGKTIVSGDASGYITLWDNDTEKIRVLCAHDCMGGESVQSLVLSPDGKIMTSASEGNIKQWDFDCLNQN